MLYLSPSLVLSSSLPLARQCTNSSRRPFSWIDARTIYIRAFLLRDISTGGFPRGTRKSRAVPLRLGSFRVIQLLQVTLLVCLLVFSLTLADYSPSEENYRLPCRYLAKRKIAVNRKRLSHVEQLCGIRRTFRVDEEKNFAEQFCGVCTYLFFLMH